MHSYLATEFKFYKINIRGKKNDLTEKSSFRKKTSQNKKFKITKQTPHYTL